MAALLLPTLNRAKVAAESAACRSNLRQIMMGTCAYVQQTGSYPNEYGVDAYPWNPVVTRLAPFVGAAWPAKKRTTEHMSFFSCFKKKAFGEEWADFGELPSEAHGRG